MVLLATFEYPLLYGTLSTIVNYLGQRSSIVLLPRSRDLVSNRRNKGCVKFIGIKLV